MIEQPGIYDGIIESDYHADPVGPAPSLSSSIAKTMVEKSPRHAWLKHPRLNKAIPPQKADRKRDIGSASHKLILGEGKSVKVLNFADYRGGAAKKARDEALAAGQVPLLADDFEKVERMAAAVRGELQGTELEGIFCNGKPEVTLVWQEPEFGGIWCRSRVDWMPDAVREGGHIMVPDLKTTSGSAHSEEWQRTGFDIGADIQAAFYERGLRRLIPGVRSVSFRFAVIEQEEPHGVSVVGMGGQALAEAHELVEAAMKTWAVCLKTGSWPGYTKETVFLDPPVYHSRSAEMRRLGMLHRIARWQRPEIDAGKAA